MSVSIDGISQPVPGATVAIGKSSSHTDRQGRALLRVRFRALGAQTLRARAAGFLSARARIRVIARRSRRAITEPLPL